MADLVSRPYNPDPEKCCEACVFGRGEHTGGPLAAISDEFAVRNDIRPQAHWHRDPAMRQWLLPAEELATLCAQLFQESNA